MHTLTEGGGNAVPFKQVWCVDFEFQAKPGERPWIVCMVARELFSKREIRLWRDELLALNRAPFDTSEDSLVVAFFASADLGCFLELGWPIPERILDPYVENRVATNGMGIPWGNGLVAPFSLDRACAHR